MLIKGIDVSYSQGNINWGAVKRSGDVDFVIIRAGYGRETSQEDSKFEANYKGCKDNGIPCGVYWYSYADSPEDAVTEAKACLEVIKGKQFEYPIYFDLEERFQFDNGSEFCNSLIKAFCNTIEDAGYYAGLYCSTSWLNARIYPEVAKRYALWVAQYYTECTYTAAPVGMWQYSSEGSVDGISGNIDVDECYVDYPSTIKNAGLNRFPKPKKKPPVLDTSGYRKGDKTIGSLCLKELLLLAKELKIQPRGMDENRCVGDGTVNAINYLLEKWGYDKTSIAGDKFAKRLAAEIMKKLPKKVKAFPTVKIDSNKDGKVNVRDLAYTAQYGPVLDKTGFKNGDKTIGSLYLKEMLLIAKSLKIHNNGMDENRCVGDGTINAINSCLAAWGYKGNGLAGEKFIMQLAKSIKQQLKNV